MDARLIHTATPRLAKLIQNDYVDKSAGAVSADFQAHHCIKVSRNYIQRISKAVSQIMIKKESIWQYALPKEVDLNEVTSIGLSRDGTTINTRKDGWRETMSGTISLYAADQELLHTIHLGTAPEYGKATFNELLTREVNLLKKQLSKKGCNPIWLGIADGAKDNWSFLNPLTDQQILDFYHASGHLGDFAQAAFRLSGARKTWMERHIKLLLEQEGGAQKVYEQMKECFDQIPDGERKDKAQPHLTYFANQLHRMNYKYCRDQSWPIGSGVVEASCKTLVKQRFVQSGMKWHIHKADMLITARALKLTPGRMEQFWKKYMRWAA